MARLFGFGTPAGIDALPGSSRACPDPEYKLSVQGTLWEQATQLTWALVRICTGDTIAIGPGYWVSSISCVNIR